MILHTRSALLQYDRLVRESEAPYEASPRAGEPSFYFAFIKSAYESFLSEDDDRVDEIKDSVAAAFGERALLMLWLNYSPVQ